MVLQSKNRTINLGGKIAFYVPFLGFGVKHHTKDQGGLAEAFVKLGYDTHLIIGGVKGNFHPPGYHIIETGNIDTGKTIRGNLKEFFTVLPIFCRKDYNYIMIWNYNRLLPLIIVFLRIYYFLGKDKPKFLLRLDWDGVFFRNFLYKIIFKSSLIVYSVFFDKIITETPCSFQKISSLLKIGKDKLSLVPVGVKEEKDLGNNKKTKTILSVARYNRIKGHDVLLKAFSTLHSSEPDWHLKICGMIQDRSYFDELSDFVNKNNLTECVELLDELSDTELQHAYMEASIFVLLSYVESFAIVRAEASYYGLPVVTTNAGCGSSYGDGVVPYGNVRAATDRILELIRNSDMRIEIARSQRRNIKTWDEIARMVLRLA